MGKSASFSWGEGHTNAFDENDMELIREYFQKTGQALVDDITWNDLDMDALYKRLNGCYSAAGDNVLYAALRAPLSDVDAIQARDTRIRRVSQPDLRDRLAKPLIQLGRDWRLHWDFFLGNAEPPSRLRLVCCLVQAVLLPVCILLFMLGIPAGLYLTLAMVLVNAATAAFAQRRMRRNVQTLLWTMRLLRAARVIAPDLMPEEVLRPLRRFKAGKVVSALYDESIPSMFAKFFLLTDVILYERFLLTLPRYAPALPALMQAVGEVDAWLAVGSWRAEGPAWCTPEFCDTPEIAIRDLRHPMIRDCVPNSITLQRSVLLTGSNASGKSTFLRAVALCAILAQALATCPAESYRARPCQVLSSMSLKDDVLSGASYFMAEIRSVLRILNYNGPLPCLAFIDEVLRGTNTGERIAAAWGVLRHLSAKGVICIAATHDGELTDLLDGEYQNYHFSELFENGEMRFDYCLRPGPSRSFNALNLIQAMGGDSGMLEEARELLRHYRETGEWKKEPSDEPAS